MDRFKSKLTPEEKEIAAPVFEIDPAILDPLPALTELRNDFFVAKFRSQAEDRCVFELGFGKKQYQNRFNFHVGLGAEYYNFELLNSSKERAVAADDLERFLRSRVTVERVLGSKGIMRERYFIASDPDLRFEYALHFVWPFWETKVQRVSLLPWLG